MKTRMQAAWPWISVFRLTRTDWRVSDSRIADDDPHCLLGYIERLDHDNYEALWLSEPIGWSYVPTFDLAVAAFADRGNFGEMVSFDRFKSSRAKSPLNPRVQHRTSDAGAARSSMTIVRSIKAASHKKKERK